MQIQWKLLFNHSLNLYVWVQIIMLLVLVLAGFTAKGGERRLRLFKAEYRSLDLLDELTSDRIVCKFKS